MNCHSVGGVLTPGQTKQIRINIRVHKRKNTKTVQTIQNIVNTSTVKHSWEKEMGKY